MNRMVQHAVVVALLCGSGGAQTTPVFRSNVEIVTVPCSVLDEHGAPVGGLSREDFVVYDNGARRILDHVWEEDDRPLTVGVIVDASESQHDQVEEHRRTVVELLRRVLMPGDRAFVVSVGEDVRLWTDVTGDVAEIGRRLAEGPGELLGVPCPKRPAMPGFPAVSACGGSPLWNAIYDTARTKLRPVAGNKALIILTDGFDTGSTHSWREAADEAHQAEATVYAVQYAGESGRRFSADLARLAFEAGGTVFEAPRGEYGAIVGRMESDLRQRYVLGFRPERLSGKARHELRVEVRHTEWTVRARRVYFEKE